MLIEKRFDLLKVMPTDDSWPTLNHFLVDKYRDEPVAIALNGFAMAIVPVKLAEEEPSDDLGMVRGDLLKYARSLARKRDNPILRLGLDTVEMTDGSTHRRRSTDGAFPDYSKIIPDLTNRESLCRTFMFNPHLVLATAKAIGAVRGSWDMRDKFLVSRFVSTGPMLIEVQEPNEDGTPQPPFALVMPMYTNGKQLEANAREWMCDMKKDQVDNDG